MLSGRHSIGVVVVIAALIGPAAAHATSLKLDAKRVRSGLTQAQTRRWLQSPDVATYRSDLSGALADVGRLPKLRAAVVSSLVGEIAAQAGSYTSPRAHALFTMLEANLSYLEANPLPRGPLDITDDDGVVYRWFAGKGFQFHPLANFGALNSLVQSGNADGARRLADALLARAVPHGPALRWEYYFRFGTGAPPWTSGMAQAVGAQALSRASALLADPSLLQAAGRAFAAVPVALVQQLSTGPWIKLYSFDREVVLNAQLQAIISLEDYAQATGDPNAAALAQQLTASAQALLPRFDTGYWSLYELGGVEASLNYQQFVTQLLLKLAQRNPDDPVWQDAATRFYGYIKQPPQIVPTPLGQPLTIYPKPRDNFLDTAVVTFTLSKRSKVTLSAGGQSVTKWLDGGQQTLAWDPGTLPPGSYPAQLDAVDLAGNTASVALDQPFVVAYDTQPPQQLQAQLDLGSSTLTWQAVDPGTPWLKVRLVLRNGTDPPTVIDLGRQALQGSLPVTLPAGTWDARVGVENSAGLWSTLELGSVTVPG
jgi:hypothetical protein